MLIIGVDYHPGVQQIAFVDTETGEFGERRLVHSTGEAEDSTASCRREYQRASRDGGDRSSRVGLRVPGGTCTSSYGSGIPERSEPRVRKQKTDRQDAQLLLNLLIENRFPRIWVAD